jgi:hypothetical protein
VAWLAGFRTRCQAIRVWRIIRRDSREYPDDAAYSTGRMSPTTGFRRASVGLIRCDSGTETASSMDEAGGEEWRGWPGFELGVKRSGSRDSREYPDDAAYSTGRMSPTTGFRRASVGLIRRRRRRVWMRREGRSGVVGRVSNSVSSDQGLENNVPF